MQTATGGNSRKNQMVQMSVYYCTASVMGLILSLKYLYAYVSQFLSFQGDSLYKNIKI